MALDRRGGFLGVGSRSRSKLASANLIMDGSRTVWVRLADGMGSGWRTGAADGVRLADGMGSGWRTAFSSRFTVSGREEMASRLMQYSIVAPLEHFLFPVWIRMPSATNSLMTLITVDLEISASSAMVCFEHQMPVPSLFALSAQ